MRWSDWRAVKRATYALSGFVLLVLLCAVPARAQDNDIDPNEHFKKAMMLHDAKDYEKALAELAIARKATSEKDDSYLVILKWQGFISIRAGRFQDAIEPLEKMIEKKPQDAEALLNLGNAYEGMGEARHPDAIKTYNKAATANPMLADPYFNLGNLYYKKRDFPKSIVAYKKAASINDKDYAIFQNLGHTYFASATLGASGDFNNAVDAYSKATKLAEEEKEATLPKPYKAKLYMHLGNACIHQYRDSKTSDSDKSSVMSLCQNSFKRAVELDPKEYDIHRYYGEALIDLGKPNEGAQQLLLASKIDDTRYDAHYNRAQALARIKPENQQEAATLAAEAVKEFGRALELASGGEQIQDALQGLGALQMRRESPETIKTLTRLTTEFPQYVGGWTTLALAREKLKDRDGAIATLELGQKKVTKQRDQAKLLRDLGAFYIAKAVENKKPGQQGDINLLNKAQKAFNESLALEADMADAYHGLGLTASWLGQLKDAISNYQRAINLNPRFAAAYNDLGVAYQDQKENDKAIAAFEKAVRFDDNPDYQKNLQEVRKAKKG